MDGIVKRIVKDKGFGFILGADGKEYFFHSSAMKNMSYAEVEEGQRVDFEEGETSKGLRAENVYAQ